jgi:hypothetical protein
MQGPGSVRVLKLFLPDISTALSVLLFISATFPSGYNAQKTLSRQRPTSHMDDPSLKIRGQTGLVLSGDLVHGAGGRMGSQPDALVVNSAKLYLFTAVSVSFASVHMLSPHSPCPR